VVFLPLLLLLVEWRPIFFLLASEPEGSQWFFLSTSMVKFHGSFVVPSGVVPGGGEVLVREKPWTRLLSPSSSWCSLCKRQGPICNFLFSFGSFCKLHCPYFLNISGVRVLRGPSSVFFKK
jgi:hypothetical protein